MFRICPRRRSSVTSGARSQWLILSSGGCLAQSEESLQNRRRAPVTGLPDQGSRPTPPRDVRVCHATHARTRNNIFTHTSTITQTPGLFLNPSRPSLHQLLCSSLSACCATSKLSLPAQISQTFVPLEFPDMISTETCSGGHALPVLPGTLIV